MRRESIVAPSRECCDVDSVISKREEIFSIRGAPESKLSARVRGLSLHKGHSALVQADGRLWASRSCNSPFCFNALSYTFRLK